MIRTKLIRLPDGSKREMPIPTVPKNLREFCLNWSKYDARDDRRQNPDFIPCTNPSCRGSGRMWHPDDEPDPIEGNRGRRQMICPTCRGTGTGDKKTMVEIFRKERARQKTQETMELLRAAAIQKTLSAITAPAWERIKSALSLAHAKIDQTHEKKEIRIPIRKRLPDSIAARPSNNRTRGSSRPNQSRKG